MNILKLYQSTFWISAYLKDPADHRKFEDMMWLRGAVRVSSTTWLMTDFSLTEPEAERQLAEYLGEGDRLVVIVGTQALLCGFMLVVPLSALVGLAMWMLRWGLAGRRVLTVKTGILVIGPVILFGLAWQYLKRLRLSKEIIK